MICRTEPSLEDHVGDRSRDGSPRGDGLAGPEHPLNSLLPGVPTTDLQPLKSALDGIRIVGLGEATHGTREFFQVKHLLMAPTQGVRRPPSLPSP